MAQDGPVRLEIEGDVGLIVLDNPPVNALNPVVADGIIDALGQCEKDPRVAAIVLLGVGRGFSAGGDIRQFGAKRRRAAIGERSSDHIDRSVKPVVAAIHGFALGGGLEEALACHYRIAAHGTKLGLTEVRVGILPGGGGTQRLPRLIGVKAGLDLIVGGRQIPAEQALALGIVDELVDKPADLRRAAVAFARRVAAIRPLPRISDRPVEAADGVFDDFRRSIARRARNQKAPFHCIAAVEAAATLPFEQGLRRERELFDELEHSEEARALRYAFFAEREVARPPGLPEATPARPVETVAIIGAGTMGGGIAMCFADNGYRVKIMDAAADVLQRGVERVRGNYAASRRRGTVTEAEVADRMARIAPVAGYDALADCDVVIEAVFEDIAVKRAVFAALDATMRPDALLFSTTGDLDIDAIAAATRRPQAVAGMHFFSPANSNTLLEVVKGAKSVPETLATAMQLGRRVGKISVLSGNGIGFVSNRSRTPLTAEMAILLEEGALPEEIDAAMVEFGYPMGPFAVSDIVGLELAYASRKRQAAANPDFRVLPIPDRLVELGRLGQKTGAGWYRYVDGDRTPHPDPAVSDIIRDMAARLGAPQQHFTGEQILRRLLFGSVNMACRILAEGIAARSSDIDAMWLNGFGFPRYRGGLMYWADGIGAGEIFRQVADWHQRLGSRWAPAPLLRALAESGTSFRDAATVGRA